MFPGDTQPKRFTLRIEPHAKGEVFAFERVEADGLTTSSCTILYLDEKPGTFRTSGVREPSRLEREVLKGWRGAEQGRRVADYVDKSNLRPATACDCGKDDRARRMGSSGRASTPTGG